MYIPLCSPRVPYRIYPAGIDDYTSAHLYSRHSTRFATRCSKYSSSTSTSSGVMVHGCFMYSIKSSFSHISSCVSVYPFISANSFISPILVATMVGRERGIKPLPWGRATSLGGGHVNHICVHESTVRRVVCSYACILVQWFGHKTVCTRLDSQRRLIRPMSKGELNYCT